MHALKCEDLNRVLDVGYQVNECKDCNELQNDALRMVQDVLSADGSVYMHAKKNANSSRFSFIGAVAHGHSENNMLNWCRRYHLQDPMIDSYMQRYQYRDGQVISSDRIISEKELLETRFYREFLEPMQIYHILLVGLMSGPEPLGVLGFHRPRNAPAFSDREIAMAGMIAPYFAAASARTYALDKIDERDWIINFLAEESLNQNVMVLDQDLEPVFVSRSFSNLLGEEDETPSSMVNGRQRLPREFMQHCLKIKKLHGSGALQTGPLKFKMKAGAQDHTLNVVLRAATWHGSNLRIIACLEEEHEQELPFHRLHGHGLTDRQIAIAQLVGVGLTNTEIAEKLDISTRTVENHLRNIYERIGVNNRTSLIYRLSLDIH